MTDRPTEPDSGPRPTPAPEGADDAWPPPRRSHALAGVLTAMLAVGVASGAYMLRHTPLAPEPANAGACARAFDSRLRTARGGTDADLVTLSEAALKAGCGRQALDAAEAVGGDADEGAAWILARFADPDASDPVFRQAAPPDPARAAALYRAWRDRSPRQAAALARLCAADRAVLGGVCGP